MTLVDNARAAMSPAVEELLEGFDSSSPQAMAGRELRVESLFALAFLVCAVAMALLVHSPVQLQAAPAAALIAAYAISTRVKFTIGFGFTVPTQLVFVPMLFLLPLGLVPLAVTLGIWLGTLPDYLSGRIHASRLLLALGNSWHALAPVLVLAIAGATRPELGRWQILLAAFASQLVLDCVVSTLREWAALGISPKLQPALLGWVALVDATLTPVGLLAAIAAVAVGWFAALLLLPLLGLLALFAGEREARIAHALELSRAYRGTTLLLSDVLEADDEYTGLHSRGVVSLSVAVADELGLDSRDRRNVEFGALLHDVGKIAVPNEIINKPGPLTDDEWLVIKAHTIEGQRMLDQVGGLLSEVGRVVRSSHERWDGSGYPDGLKGDEIPLSSAIVACCDAVNAMTTDRPYRPARTVEQAIEELIAESGKQFNPVVVGALTRILARSLAGHQPLDEEPSGRRIGIFAQPVPAE